MSRETLVNISFVQLAGIADIQKKQKIPFLK